MNEIDFHSITKKFNNFEFGPISLRIREGEHLLVSGPNGSGKSTLLKIISGSLSCDEGRISGSLGETAWIDVECQGLFSRLSGGQNINFFANILKVNDSYLSDRLQRWEQFSGFSKALCTPYIDCSSGMQFLLKLFCLTLHHPKLIVMDEPLRLLDKENRQVFKNVLEKEFSSCAVVISSHIDEDLVMKRIKMKEGHFVN